MFAFFLPARVKANVRHRDNQSSAIEGNLISSVTHPRTSDYIRIARYFGCRKFRRSDPVGFACICRVEPMRKILKWLIGLPVAVVLVALSMMNNQKVTLLFDPISAPDVALSVSIPVYVVFFVGLLIGIVIGGIATWARQGRFRSAARENRKEAMRWRVKAETLEADRSASAPVPGLPALTNRS